MLLLLNLAQLVLYIGLLSMAGRAVLHPLVKATGGNVVQQLLCLLTEPFSVPVRRLLRALAPARASERVVACVTAALLLLAYALVTLARMDHCLSAGLIGQPGCR